MKKLFILMFMTGLVLAQPLLDTPDRDRIEMMKMWRLTDELEMTEEQADKFFPKYRMLMSSLEEISKQQHELMEQIGELSERDEVNSEKLHSLVKKAGEFEKKKIDLKYEFFAETGNFFTPEQQARYVVFEQQFRRQLKKGIRDRGRERRRMEHGFDREPRLPRGRGRDGF
ncbi:MAG: hypothetical protein ACE5EE_09430 [Fidelibacterota bacterium]